MNLSFFFKLKKYLNFSTPTSIILIIIISIAIQFILYLLGFFSISADESDRSIQAYNWAIGNPVYDASWLPLHRIILGIGFKVLPDIFWLPRFINYFFGILLLPLMAWLSQSLFHSKKNTILSTLLVCFFFPRIILSSVPLTESIFITFIISGIALFVNWLTAKQNLYLILASVLFLLGSAIRYEGWIFSASFGLLVTYLLISKNYNIGIKYYFVILVIISSFPVYWLYYHSIESGGAFSFLYSATDNYTSSHGGSFKKQFLNSLFPQFTFQNLVSLNFLGLIPFFFLLKKDMKIKLFSIIVLTSFSIMVLATSIGKALPSHNFWRIPAVWSFILIPFTAYFLLNINEYYKKPKPQIKYLLLILFIVFNLLMTSYEVNKRSSFTEVQIQTGKYLEKILDRDKNIKVLIETSSWDYPNILVASQHPNNFLLNTGVNPKIPGKSILSDSTSLEQLNNRNIKYFLFKSHGLRKILNEKNDFDMVKVFGEWFIYKLNLVD
ncbi:MAG: phospholipid carrier-dependent glycosyltransferase [Ignavibacteriae bacterium]|nr:phospholipid carrier-dependent glycosyltransferase [Ignavibacteriota bacterium]NOH00416.1 phospholipid carrier-dependent glycosyltransferase [Ignavibacteriota bacterium]